ncbi:hypothetical protein [Vibrio gazogenes]|uniref:hypothetical protein n=1 Tax=Vibrio gazogenes TaxID=687 RepID=UPI0035A05688
MPDNKCKKLIVSSCLPPKLFMKKLMSSGNIDDLVEQLISNDAVPSVIKENDMVTENTRNRIKNHISILQDYKVNRSKELDIPICAISSHRDLIAPYKDMKLWCDYTCNYFTHQLVFGDHFYFRENSRLIDKIV